MFVWIARFLLGLIAAFALNDPCVYAQARASATPATPLSGRPSSIQIKQNLLSQKIAILQRDLIEVRRCIYTSSLPQVLRDPAGFANSVPKTDIVNCSRQLQTIIRKLARLNRESSQLVQDAQMQAITIQRLLAAQKAKARQQALSDQ